MNISTKIKLAAKYAGISEAELARRFGVTPQNLNNRFKVDRFTTEDLEKLAELLETTPPEELHTIPVEETWLDGERVYGK